MTQRQAKSARPTAQERLNESVYQEHVARWQIKRLLRRYPQDQANEMHIEATKRLVQRLLSEEREEGA
jgi:hypothetical protein